MFGFVVIVILYATIGFLAAAGVWPDRVVERQRDLEDIFLDLTHASEAS